MGLRDCSASIQVLKDVRLLDPTISHFSLFGPCRRLIVPGEWEWMIMNSVKYQFPLYLLSRWGFFDDGLVMVFWSLHKSNRVVDVTQVFLSISTIITVEEWGFRWRDQQSKSCSVLPQRDINSLFLGHNLLPRDLDHLYLPQGVPLVSFTDNMRSFAPSEPSLGTTMDLKLEHVPTRLWDILAIKI